MLCPEPLTGKNTGERNVVPTYRSGRARTSCWPIQEFPAYLLQSHQHKSQHVDNEDRST